jgi:hypothetical protein
MPEDSIIIFDDEPIPPPKDPKQLEIEKVANQVRQAAMANLQKSSNLADFLKWHNVARWSSPEFLGWMWDETGGPTTEDILSDPSVTQNFERDAKVIGELGNTLASMEDKPGQIKIGLKRLRDNRSGRYEYRVLAEFPDGYHVYDDVLTRKTSDTTKSQIYFDPTTACIEHACDDLYKAHKDTNGFFYIAAKDYNGAYKTRMTQYATAQAAEYQEVRNQSGVSENDLLFALIGGFSNEKQRTRISDFKTNQISQHQNKLLINP